MTPGYWTIRLLRSWGNRHAGDTISAYGRVAVMLIIRGIAERVP